MSISPLPGHLRILGKVLQSSIVHESSCMDAPALGFIVTALERELNYIVIRKDAGYSYQVRPFGSQTGSGDNDNG